MLFRFRSSKKSFVVTYNAGLPGTSLNPETLIQFLSNRDLMLLVLTETPLISSISPLVTGCLNAIIEIVPLELLRL
jgi:hypothetical protein